MLLRARSRDAQFLLDEAAETLSHLQDDHREK
jgi:hypothetical protein